MNYREKNTKIVATISDLKCDVEFLQELYDKGLDVVRINTAHPSVEGVKKVIQNTRAVSDKIALLLDTKGPEIRTAGFEEPKEIKSGQEVKITGPKENSESDEIPTSYPGIVTDVPEGASILIDDGLIEFKVLSKTQDALICAATNDGVVKKKKSVNVPDVHIALPSITEKDKQFIELAVQENLDFIAHSFVRNKADCLAVQEILDKHKSPMKIIAKIENREGVDNIDEILDHCYGVMVARGDLAVEVPAAEVPLMQKRMIQRCTLRAKPVIVATQMLESMISNPRPTRAEVSDVANAILDGTSAIMLSGETAYGEYPVDAVRTMSEVSLDLKKRRKTTQPKDVLLKPNDIQGYLGHAAVDAALEFDAKAIVVPSIGGKTARYISSLRSRKPIYAPCYDDRVMRLLALSHGVIASHIGEHKTTDEMVRICVQDLVDKGDITQDDLIVFVGGTPQSFDHRSNFLEIAKVKDILCEYKA
jgi:pyruvate kinase